MENGNNEILHVGLPIEHDDVIVVGRGDQFGDDEQYENEIQKLQLRSLIMQIGRLIKILVFIFVPPLQGGFLAWCRWTTTLFMVYCHYIMKDYNLIDTSIGMPFRLT